jgi:hypothetical protein
LPYGRKITPATQLNALSGETKRMAKGNRNGAASRLPKLDPNIDEWAIYDALHPEDKAFLQNIPEKYIWVSKTDRITPESKARYWVRFAEATLKTYGPDHPQAQRSAKQRKVELSLTDLL